MTNEYKITITLRTTGKSPGDTRGEIKVEIDPSPKDDDGALAVSAATLYQRLNEYIGNVADKSNKASSASN